MSVLIMFYIGLPVFIFPRLRLIKYSDGFAVLIKWAVFQVTLRTTLHTQEYLWEWQEEKAYAERKEDAKP